MRKFHTYVDTPKGLVRGFGELQKNALLDVDLLGLIESVIRKKGSCKVLELGCGKCNVLLYLCSVFSDVVCVGVNKFEEHGFLSEDDLLKYALESGLVLKSVPVVMVSDASDLPFDDLSFDIVISQVSFMHFEDKLKALSEVSRVLRVGGFAFVDLDSWELKEHKPVGVMSQFYVDLWNHLKFDVTPRIILEKNGSFVAFKDLFSEFVNFKVDFKTKVIDESKGSASIFKQVVHVNKLDVGKFDFPFVRDSFKSDELTNLEITNENPASFGVVDYYKFEK